MKFMVIHTQVVSFMHILQKTEHTCNVHLAKAEFKAAKEAFEKYRMKIRGNFHLVDGETLWLCTMKRVYNNRRWFEIEMVQGLPMDYLHSVNPDLWFKMEVAWAAENPS